MGQFESGRWVLGLSLYFFGFFIIMISIISSANELDIEHDASVADIGFQSELNPYTDGVCTGTLSYFDLLFCDLDGTDTNESCSIIGCDWDGTDCTGSVNSTLIPSPSCVLITNRTICEVLEEDGCRWIDRDEEDYIDPNSGYSNGGFVNTIKFLFGFDANIGIPRTYQFIISFIFFWIPFTALLWSIYMSLPFLH